MTTGSLSRRVDLPGGVPAPPTALRVVSVPSHHVYVDHLAPVRGPARIRQVAVDAPSQTWRPSPALTPAWLQEHAGSYDAVHVHFGFEHRSADELACFADALETQRVPLVLTVHDLVNPHLTEQRPHRAALNVLVRRADAVLTLTPGAAAEILGTWGVTAEVVPHPHVVPLDRLSRERPRHLGFRVGVHDKERANVHAAAARDELAGTGITVEPPLGRRLTDDELWDHLSALDALVLPYAFGTHSGFLEACHDLGTHVVVPRLGYYAQQHAVVSYDLAVRGSLAAAVRRVREQGPALRPGAAARIAQRNRVAAVHADLFERLTARLSA
ncbi:MAG: hypothetical protein JWL64_787 [Frankiales bacterium]|nr:hypothetical protein [Frankiales bacterium]